MFKYGFYKHFKNGDLYYAYDITNDEETMKTESFLYKFKKMVKNILDLLRDLLKMSLNVLIIKLDKNNDLNIINSIYHH